MAERCEKERWISTDGDVGTQLHLKIKVPPLDVRTPYLFRYIDQVYNYVVGREIHFEKHKSTFHISQMAPPCTLIIH